jgi:hypothetical protein
MCLRPRAKGGDPDSGFDVCDQYLYVAVFNPPSPLFLPLKLARLPNQQPQGTNTQIVQMIIKDSKICRAYFLNARRGGSPERYMILLPTHAIEHVLD